ncbi:MAG: pyruvate kinase, partial [Abditibacteriaceae bacterium]
MPLPYRTSLKSTFMFPKSRRAKIVCTIGPASDSESMLTRLLENGMNVARFNFSHGGPQQQNAAISRLRALSKKLDKPVAILQDLQGPRIRLGEVKNGIVEIKAGDQLSLTTRHIVGNSREVSVSYAALPTDCKPGDAILINDGLIRLRVDHTTATEVHTTILVGGALLSKKGLNLPGVDVSTPSLSDKDRTDALWGAANQMDLVALSFVRNADDIHQLRDLIKNTPAHPQIIAKIEKPEAIDNLDEILEAADGVMVARGDLGVEMGVEVVPLLQKQIIAKANAAGKLVITATQMLESMCENPTPTRAESSDVANAILDGTDAVMLSAETTIGKFPLESLQTMARIVETIENSSPDIWFNYRQERRVESTFPDIICQAAAHAATGSAARCIAVFTESGKTARLLAKYHPHVPVYAFTCHLHVVNQLQVAWGVQAFQVERTRSTDEMLLQAEEELRRRKLASPGDTVIIALGA